MNRKQLESRAYAKPAFSVCALQTESLLQTFSSQHHDAEHGGTFGDAKQGWLDDEDEEDGLTHSPSPKGEGSYQLWNE